jgi:aminoglycoside phosphotransferase (APT) family kinase protein
VNDPELDRWMEDFLHRRTRCHPLHADYYRGNVLVRDRAIVGAVDWDDVFVGPPEQELAWAAWEWGRGLASLDLEPALSFIDRYIATGGTAERIDVGEFARLVRARIRMDVIYSHRAGTWGTSTDPDDIAYEESELRAFRALRTIADS